MPKFQSDFPEFPNQEERMELDGEVVPRASFGIDELDQLMTTYHWEETEKGGGSGSNMHPTAETHQSAANTTPQRSAARRTISPPGG